MDFQSLTRRELQTLCKKNKIPANMTNIAMADALKALEIVEGMEEISKPSESETARSSVESPEEMVITSPTVPRTGCRTSTQRKLIKEEPESSQTLTRTRRGTRRTLAAEVEETKNGVPETPAASSGRKRAPAASARRKMESQLNECEEDQKNEDQMVRKMKDVPETPAAPSGRRRATAASSRRKMETDLRGEKEDVNSRGLKEESSVRRMYSTRRSVRLSEKKMTESNPKEKEKTKAIKIDSIFKEMPKDLEGKSTDDLEDLGEVSESTQMSGMCLSSSQIGQYSWRRFSFWFRNFFFYNYYNAGVDLPEISEEGSERINDSKVLSDQKCNVLPENGRDFDYDPENKGDDHQVEDWKATRGEVSEVYDEMDVVSVSDEQFRTLIIEKDGVVEYGVHDESKGDDSLSISEVVSEKCDESDEVLQYKGFAVDKLPSDMENSTEVLNLEKENDSNVDQDLALEDSAAAVNGLAIEDPTKIELDALNLTVSAIDQDRKQDIELALASEEESNSSDDEETTNQDQDQDFELGLASEKERNGKHSSDDQNQYIELKLASEEQFNGRASSDDAETDTEYLELKLTAEEEYSKVSVDDVEAHSDIPEQLDRQKEPKVPHVLNSEESKSFTDQFIIDSNNSSEVFSADEESDFEKSKQLDSEKEPKVPHVHNSEESKGCTDQFISDSNNASEVFSADEESDSEKSVTEESRKQVSVAFSDIEMNLDNVAGPCLAKEIMSETQAGVYAKEHMISEDFVADQFDNGRRSMDFGNVMALCHAEDPTLNMEKSPKAWVDVYEVPAQESNGTTHELPSSLDITAAPVHQSLTFSTSLDKTPFLLVPSAEVTGDIALSTLVADPLPAQNFSSLCPVGSDSGLASVTPRKKSSSKAPATCPRMIHVLDDNKENIDNSGRKLDLTRIKGKKNKKNNTAEDNQLKSLSIRQLSKMLKEQLQITNDINNNEEKNIAKVKPKFSFCLTKF
ncbi:hypothetical protein F0562_031076 [Nyssa sinensis]|uniref:Uncharacterized protein n=1 Tax=Nyssa sinensis TaxID=561372 RepID=A0A5J5ASC7_9ASTE|nr:hypothetical protein F0562_031076 [Nyssa sinensis]